jgi:hypothetical protein
VSGTFTDRMRALEDQVGPGRLTGSVVVDQVYAKYQELREDLRHPGGGQAHYLQGSLYDDLDAHMQRLTSSLVTEDGSAVRKGMENVAEAVAHGVYERAPFEFGDLKASPHPTVTDDGATIYDRPPMVHRLTDDELRAKGHLRRLGLGHATDPAAIRRALGAT